MRKTRITTLGAVLAGMLALIFDGKTALSGGQAGIEVCIRTVIPSLFPFFVVSILLTGSISGLSLPLSKGLRQLLGIPVGGESVLVCGFLGGYPVGAQCAASLYRNGGLSKEEAERMLCFCSNAGPAFLFGMAAALFPNLGDAWVLWGIHIFSALLVRLFIPARDLPPIPPARFREVSVSEALERSLHIMASVCAWVILFRVIIALLDRWVLWLLPAPARIGLIGVLELANGCYELAGLQSIPQRFLLCAGMLSFGGICVAMQTRSVTQGLSLRYYYWGKLIQGCVSLLLAWAYLSELLIPTLLGLCVSCFFAHHKINGSNPAKCVV